MPVSLVTQPTLLNHVRPMWEVERARAPDGSIVIRLGDARFAVSEVARHEARTEVTRYRHGRVVAMLLFGVLAALYVVGVIEFELRRNFLLAGFICAAVALMSLEDVVFARPDQRLSSFEVALRDGRVVRWTTANEADAAAVAAVLSGRA